MSNLSFSRIQPQVARVSMRLRSTLGNSLLDPEVVAALPDALGSVTVPWYGTDPIAAKPSYG